MRNVSEIIGGDSGPVAAGAARGAAEQAAVRTKAMSGVHSAIDGALVQPPIRKLETTDGEVLRANVEIMPPEEMFRELRIMLAIAISRVERQMQARGIEIYSYISDEPLFGKPVGEYQLSARPFDVRIEGNKARVTLYKRKGRDEVHVDFVYPQNDPARPVPKKFYFDLQTGEGAPVQITASLVTSGPDKETPGKVYARTLEQDKLGEISRERFYKAARMINYLLVAVTQR